MRPSKTSMYWSTQETMRDLVDNIIAPYFESKKKDLGLPPEQRSIWKIDCWSVHKSEEFRTWMKQHHATIIIIFVPGGCTSVWRPLDIGFQRVLKLSIKRSAHRDIVQEVTAQMSAKPPQPVRLDTSVRTLRNRTVSWIVNAVNELSNKELILKASSPTISIYTPPIVAPRPLKALAALRNLFKTDRDFLAELEAVNDDDASLAPVADADEAPFSADPFEDSSDVPLDVVCDFVTTEGTVVADGFATNADGNIVRSGSGEDPEAEDEDVSAAVAPVPVELGRGNRVRKVPKLFGGSGL
ncbi:hypothetical protein LshimejAT787_2500570 [Lyophyllum shimeji]|uniref:DDE-1 domain-containing protein n=1 Tax=Lyophyllum shimeji TaxID=47721 RepID=A0A9P3Q115_LYOSH|nr:hypothetical protein LshimejAT787_2500570 [Lyophyllum shimeji]